MRRDPTIFRRLPAFLALLVLAASTFASAQRQFVSAPIYPVAGFNPGQAVVGTAIRMS